MGRLKKNIVTTEQCLKIDLSYLLKHGFISKGKPIQKQLQYHNGFVVDIVSYFKKNAHYLTASYTLKDRSGKREKHHCRIDLITVPSNLGRGNILYFLCPTTGKKCRLLFLSRSSAIFQAKSAYKERIYYPKQLSSHRQRPNDRFWALADRLVELNGMRETTTYNSHLTKRFLLMEKIYKQYTVADYLRFHPKTFPVRLRKILFPPTPATLEFLDLLADLEHSLKH